MRRVVVTGVAGFVGSHLAEALLDAGTEVIGIDNFSQGDRRNLVRCLGRDGFHLLEQDVCEAATWVSLPTADAIAHLAAFKIPRYGNALATLEINTHGTRHALDYAVRHHARLLFTSTSDVYGKNPSIPFRETHDLVLGPTDVPRWAYAASKIFDEHLCFAYAQRHPGLEVVIVRYFGGYGPHQHLDWWGGPQSVFIGCALRDTPMPLHGDGQQTRTFTFVSDLVDGTVRALRSPEAPGQVFNIGNTSEITIDALARLVWGLVRPRTAPKIETTPYATFGKYEDVRRRVPDITKARTVLGFDPQVALEAGLARTVEWQRGVSGVETHHEQLLEGKR
jgi:UDP-glucose 4-epimerase